MPRGGSDMARNVLLAAIAVIASILFISCQESVTDSTDSDSASGSTLDVVLDRGQLICGVKVDTPGFGVLNPDGSRAGNDVEFCRILNADNLH